MKVFKPAFEKVCVTFARDFLRNFLQVHQLY